MKIGIMQPYFFPYLGYYSLIKNTDQWVVLDTVQYIRHGWIDRNRILKPNEGWQYINVPLLAHPRETLICNIEINDNAPWRSRIFGQLEHYKKRAPFYKAVRDVVNESLSISSNSIVDINVNALKTSCKYLQIDFHFEVFSKMGMSLPPITEPDDWALYISKAMNAAEYINPPGGLEFFNREKFIDHKIKLSFLQNSLSSYQQVNKTFIPGLSIIDVMMFNSPKEVCGMLDNFSLL